MRAWLVEERGLEAFRVDGLHGTGLLGADARGNAVFLCRDIRGRVTGAELVGTRRTVAASGAWRRPARRWLSIAYSYHFPH